MTKDSYFEMCQMLGSEPKDSEIPIEFSDLLLEVQEAFQIYNALQDTWEYMGGNYTGKNFNYIESIFRIYSIPSEMHKEYYDLLILIDRLRTKNIQDNKPKEQKAR